MNWSESERAVKQIGPMGASERTKAALLLIDCKISLIYPSGTVVRQWQMEADWTPGQKKRPAKPAVKLPTIVGHNTATRSLFNRTWQRTEKGRRGLGGIKKGQKRRLGLLEERDEE